MRPNNIKKILALALLFAASSTFAAVTKPGAPRWVMAIADGGTGQVNSVIATVTFSPPASNGGGTITSYTVSCIPACTPSTGPASPIRVGGLSEGTAYTFTVTATNSAGTGAASDPSNSAPACDGFVGSTYIQGYVRGTSYHWSSKIQGNNSGSCVLAAGCDGFIDFYVAKCSNGTTPAADASLFSSKTLNFGPSYDNTLVDAFYYVRNSKQQARFDLHPTTGLVMGISAHTR